MFITIIIPAYNEQNKIGLDIKAASEFLSSHSTQSELLIVDDGSTDKTVEHAEQICSELLIDARVISIPHAGKGAAVREGIISSKGKIVMFADTGLCISYDEALTGIELIKKGECDFAHATRYRHDSTIVKPKGFLRKLASSFFRNALPWAVGIKGKYSDTQCGFKVYDGETAREVYKNCTSTGYFFDLEVILRAERSNVNIAEFPVRWTSDPDSRLSLFKSVLRMIFVVRKIRRAVKK